MSEWKSKKAYVVYQGRKLGIYLIWAECDAQVSGFKGNRYKAYQSIEEAEGEWMKYCNSSSGGAGLGQ